MKNTPGNTLLAPDLPPLPDYWAPPEDPKKLAAPFDPHLADLYISHGGDGMLVALATPRDGDSRREIAERWTREWGLHGRGEPMDPARRDAARAHVARYFDLSGTVITVPPAKNGMDSLAYSRYVLGGPLLMPHREEDTDLRLSTLSRFIVPGTRFSDPFPADNAIAALGLLADGKTEGQIEASLLATGNTARDTMRFGYAPNFSKLAMLRGQTELDTLAMEATRGLYGNAALVHWRDALLRNINFQREGSEVINRWPSHIYGAYRRRGRLPNGLHPYRDWDDTPVSYKERGIIRVESAEKDRETGEKAIFSIKDEGAKARRWVKVQKGLAIGAASFQDMSDYQLGDRINLETIQATDIYTSWRQSTMAHKIRLAAEASEILGEYTTAERLWKEFDELKQIMALMWRQTGEDKGHYTDLWLNGEQTGALNAAQILPLLVGNDFVPYDHARMTINLFREKLLGPYGLHTSDIIGCPEQWTGDNDWPSLAILAMHASMEQAREAKRRGQDPEPFLQFAEDLQEALIKGVDAWYEEHKTLAERINGSNPKKIALGGEYCSPDEEGNMPEPQIGFAMTAGALMNAKIFNLRTLFEFIDPNRSWLSQCFAINLGRLALAA